MPATFLPLVIRDPASASAEEQYGRYQPLRLSEDGKTVWTYTSHFYYDQAMEGAEVSLDFTLADLEPGKCVIGGLTTRGCLEVGVYYGHAPGRYICFDGSQQGSLLWNGYFLVRGPLADRLLAREARRKKWLDKVCAKLEEMKAAGEDTECIGTPAVSDDEDGPLRGPPCKRTDSGTNYGFTGHPDVEFWARSGIVADAFVPARVYNGYHYENPLEEMEEHHLRWQYEQIQNEIAQLRKMNTDGISPALQAAINKQAGCLTAELEAFQAEISRRGLAV